MGSGNTRVKLPAAGAYERGAQTGCGLGSGISASSAMACSASGPDALTVSTVPRAAPSVSRARQPRRSLASPRFIEREALHGRRPIGGKRRAQTGRPLGLTREVLESVGLRHPRLSGRRLARSLCDVTDWTCHPDRPEPAGITAWSPVKLYTGAVFVDWIREHGGVAQVYWDDLEIWESWPPGVGP